MTLYCKMCGEDSDTCLPNEDGDSVCECCHSRIVRDKHLADKALRDLRESAWAEQDERSERDGGYKVQPIRMTLKQAD